MRRGLVLAALASAALVAVPGLAQGPDCSTQLIAGNESGDLFYVDIGSGSGTFVGPMPIESTEVEFDIGSGRLFAEEADGGLDIHEIDPLTGGSLGFATHGCCALTGMEYIGGILYATNIQGGGGGSPSEFVMVDPDTGAMSLIGLTGVGPISGLAYNEMTGVLYGVTAGGAIADLVTIDIGSGAATIVGSTGLDRIGSLEFGPDGNLYGGMTASAGSFARFLVQVDTSTGAVTPIGDTGFSITGLTACEMAPVPAVPPLGLMLLALVLVGLGAWAVLR